MNKRSAGDASTDDIHEFSGLKQGRDVTIQFKKRRFVAGPRAPQAGAIETLVEGGDER